MLLYLNFEVLSGTLLLACAANFHEVLSECLCITRWINHHFNDTITFFADICVREHMLVFGHLGLGKINIKLNMEIILDGES